MQLVLEIKKIYSNKIFKWIYGGMATVFVCDPITTFILCQKQSGFAETIGRNSFQYWLLMNSSGWGHAIYFMLFLIFPIISTGFVYFYERKGTVFISAISKASRKKYFLDKALASFIATFLNFIFLFLLNLLITYLLFEENVFTEQYYYCVPQKGSFAVVFYNMSPFIMGIVYSIMNALIQGILAIWALVIQMIGKFKKIYTAFAVPCVVLYIMEYIIGLISETLCISKYNPLIFIQPQAASSLNEIIKGYHILISITVMLIITAIFFVIGMKRNEDIL